MKKSRLNPEIEINEKNWAVSIVNTNGTTSGAILGGHSAIIVEGFVRKYPKLTDTEFFYGYYDIRARPWPEEEETGSLQKINKKGYIFKITVKEDNKYPSDADEKFSKYYIGTKPVLGEERDSVIRVMNREPTNKEKEKVVACREILIINKQGHYEIGFYKQIDDKYEQKILKIELPELKEMKHDSIIENLEIRKAIFNQCSSCGGSVQQKSVRKMIQSIKEDERRILNIDGEFGSGGNPNKSLYPAWELIGMDTIFGSQGRGMNCANWCADKLFIAGIGDGSQKKPGCIIS